MSARIRCPQCAASLKLKSLEVLRKQPKCPACSFRLSENNVELPDADVIMADAAGYESNAPEADPSAMVDPAGGVTCSGEQAAEQPLDPSIARLFFRINSTRVSFREYWWGNRNPLVLIGWLIKLLRIRLPSSTDDPPVRELAPFRTDYSSFSEDAKTDIAAIAPELRNEGFHTPVFHLIRDDLHSTRYHYLSLADASGRTVAQVMRRFWSATQPPRKRLFTTFITEFSDGRFVTTTNASADMLWPGTVELQRDVKAAPVLLWKKHQDRLQQMAGSGQPVTMRGAGDLHARLERYHQSLAEFHHQRGVFAELTAADEKKLIAAREASTLQSSDSISPATDEHRDVMVEIEARQNRQSGWVGSLLLLVVSLAVFIGLGAVNWSWNFLLMLVPILFVHELGHYVAMKAFGYRNLKMFFIPMFGAAVTGQSYNVEGWKKVVVSLAGPVPGIVLGAVLGTIGLVTDRSWMIDCAVLALIINGLNLIPVLPLDGGWVVHTLFFSRHYGFDVAFRIVAAIALCGASIAFGDRILAGLVVAMLMGIPTILRSGRIVQRLRGTPEIRAVNNQSIPRQAAHVILDKIQKEFPATAINTKARANLTLSIFESLNSPAPGAGGTILLSGAHFGSIAGAIIFLFVLILGRHSNFLDLINLAGGAPETPYVCGSGQAFHASGVESPIAEEEVCIVGNFATDDLAQSVFSELKGQLPAGGVLRVFGSSLLLALPAGDDDGTATWTTNFESRGAKTAVRSNDFSVSFSILGIAPSEEVARKTERELRQLLSSNIGGAMLIPPWLPDRPLSEQQQKARRTMLLLQGAEPDDEGPDGDTDAERADEPEVDASQLEAKRLQQFSIQIMEANRRGQKAVAQKLQKELNVLMKQQEKERLDRIKLAGPEKIDIELVDIYSERPVYSDFQGDDQEALKKLGEQFTLQTAEWQNRIQERLGTLASAVAVPVNPAEASPASVNPSEVRHAVLSGYVSRAGLILRLDYLTFRREVDGLPPLVDWLCSRGFVDLKYNLSFDDVSSEDFAEDL